jgi:hypothetical protein
MPKYPRVLIVNQQRYRPSDSNINVIKSGMVLLLFDILG